MQHRRFKAILDSSGDHRWNALRVFINLYSESIGLQTAPLPFFGESYYVSGSFIYYEKLSLRLDKDYFELCVDHTDPPVFWPLTIHEIAHCWLSKRDYVNTIITKHSQNIRQISLDMASSRIEESLCDIIATRIMGPAYPIAFLNRLWAQLEIESPDYPRNRFRIECMARMLDIQGFLEEAIFLRDIGDEKFDYSYEDEEIYCTLDDLCAVTHVIPTILIETVKEQFLRPIRKMQLKNREDFSSIFYVSWRKILEVDKLETESTIDSISQILLNSLIGSAKSTNSST